MWCSLCFVEITAAFFFFFTGDKTSCRSCGAASFVRLDSDVISSVCPHPSAPWSEGPEIDIVSAGLLSGVEAHKVTGDNEWRRDLVSL